MSYHLPRLQDMKPNPAPLGTWWQPISPAKKKEEDRIDDKTCTIDTVSRQFWVYFERIFEYHTIGLNYSLFLTTAVLSIPVL